MTETGLWFEGLCSASMLFGINNFNFEGEKKQILLYVFEMSRTGCMHIAQIILIGKMDRGLMPESFSKGQTGRLIYLELSGLAADMGAEDAQLGTGSESDWKIR